MGKDLLDWFRKVLRHFNTLNLGVSVWDDDNKHLCFLKELYQLRHCNISWLTMDQLLYVYGIRGPVTDEFRAELPLFSLISRWVPRVSAPLRCKGILIMFLKDQLDLMFL